MTVSLTGVSLMNARDFPVAEISRLSVVTGSKSKSS